MSFPGGTGLVSSKGKSEILALNLNLMFLASAHLSL